MRIFLCLLVSVICAGCGSIYVTHDYNQTVDFTAYTTYNYIFSEDQTLSEFDERRFVKATDSILAQKNLSLAENPDIWIALNASEYETTSRNTLGVGLGSGGGNVGVSVGGGIPIGGREQHQMIALQFIDSETNTTIWEATSESDLKVQATPATRDAYFKKLVAKIFKSYPPKS